MSGPAILAPRAQRELRDAIRWVAADNEAAARKLRDAVDAVDAATRRLGVRPQLGRPRLDLAPARYRFWSLTEFSLLLVYDAEIEPVIVLRVVHTARDLPKVLRNLAF